MISILSVIHNSTVCSKTCADLADLLFGTGLSVGEIVLRRKRGWRRWSTEERCGYKKDMQLYAYPCYLMVYSNFFSWTAQSVRYMFIRFWYEMPVSSACCLKYSIVLTFRRMVICFFSLSAYGLRFPFEKSYSSLILITLSVVTALCLCCLPCWNNPYYLFIVSIAMTDYQHIELYT